MTLAVDARHVEPVGCPQPPAGRNCGRSRVERRAGLHRQQPAVARAVRPGEFTNSGRAAKAREITLRTAPVPAVSVLDARLHDLHVRDFSPAPPASGSACACRVRAARSRAPAPGSPADAGQAGAAADIETRARTVQPRQHRGRCRARASPPCRQARVTAVRL